jgi:hypothetical protein
MTGARPSAWPVADTVLAQPNAVIAELDAVTAQAHPVTTELDTVVNFWRVRRLAITDSFVH